MWTTGKTVSKPDPQLAKLPTGFVSGVSTILGLVVVLPACWWAGLLIVGLGVVVEDWLTQRGWVDETEGYCYGPNEGPSEDKE